MKHFNLLALVLAVTIFAAAMTGCGAAPSETAASGTSSAEAGVSETIQAAQSPLAAAAEADSESVTQQAEAAAQSPAVTEEDAEEIASEGAVVTTLDFSVTDGLLDPTELFTERDLEQTADLSEAVRYVLTDGEDIHITSEGVYVLTGTAANVTVYVEAGSEDKVQIVLDGASITNDDFPCIYVTGADKVFVTTTETENTLAVTGAFVADGDTNTDGVIFSRSDLVLNGTGVLNISSTENGVVGKDDLKVTGGTYNINAASKAIEANDSIRIAAGTFSINAGTDGLHAENDDDDTLGYIYICGGDITVIAGDDGIHAVSLLQIDGGSLDITAAEGLEGTYIQINAGTINIQASDDGINGAQKSSAYVATVEFNGGETTVVMGSGDTDGVDCNGNLIINGGTIDVTGQSTFDYDGSGVYNGGTIIVNGQQVTSIPNQMMGGGAWG